MRECSSVTEGCTPDGFMGEAYGLMRKAEDHLDQQGAADRTITLLETLAGPGTIPLRAGTKPPHSKRQAG